MHQLFKTCLLTVLGLSAFSAHAKVTIFDVRKNLPLSDREPVFKDFYLNAGMEEGIREGMIIEVVRRVPIHDSLKNQSQGDLVMNIARIRILHVQRSISVARIYSDTTAKTRPVADFSAIMIGDEVDLNSAMVPVEEKPKRRKTSKRKAPVKMPKKEPEFLQPEPRQPAQNPRPMIPSHARGPMPMGGEFGAEVPAL